MSHDRQALALMMALAAGACGSNSGNDSHGRKLDGGDTADSGAQGDHGGGSDGDGGDLGDGGDHGDGDGDAHGDGGVCASVSAPIELSPIFLAFAFDVSGSMGKGDKLWYDKTKKWDPVTSAARMFFAEPGSSNVSASLTFFPVKDSNSKCKEASYEVPDVAMSGLPSTAFGAALDAMDQEIADSDWRGDTPTRYALEGTRRFLSGYKQGREGQFAIVLVTDGEPQGCSSGNTIDDSVHQVEMALADGIPTYVIGVDNPDVPGVDEPHDLDNLKSIAEAGNTEKAIIINTDDPDATVATFISTINSIRTNSISCNMAIPAAPSGQEFDPTKVGVYRQEAGTRSDFAFDKDCSRGDGWKYDNDTSPTEIVLCPSACDALKQDSGAELRLEFKCKADPGIVLF